MIEKLEKFKTMWKKPLQGRFLTIKEMLSYAVAGVGVSFIVNVISIFLTAEMIPYMYQINVIHGRNIFTDFESNDFSFKENSPAYELGISEIDVNKIGVQHNWYF